MFPVPCQPRPQASAEWTKLDMWEQSDVVLAFASKAADTVCRTPLQHGTAPAHKSEQLCTLLFDVAVARYLTATKLTQHVSAHLYPIGVAACGAADGRHSHTRTCSSPLNASTALVCPPGPTTSARPPGQTTSARPVLGGSATHTSFTVSSCRIVLQFCTLLTWRLGAGLCSLLNPPDMHSSTDTVLSTAGGCRPGASISSCSSRGLGALSGYH